jgi:adenylate kinase
LSAGDLLRDAVKKGNAELEAIMKEGKLVPMETTIALLKDAMIASGASMFLIDGFPRALDQAEAFERQVLSDVHVGACLPCHLLRQLQANT